MKKEELSIKEIKAKVLDTLLDDTRIVSMLGGDDKNLFAYLSGGLVGINVGTYIYFDVAETNSTYKLIFKVRTHKDLLCHVPSNLDRVVDNIRKDVLKIYPTCHQFDIEPARAWGSFVEKRMRFVIFKTEIHHS